MLNILSHPTISYSKLHFVLESAKRRIEDLLGKTNLGYRSQQNNTHPLISDWIDPGRGIDGTVAKLIAMLRKASSSWQNSDNTRIRLTAPLPYPSVDRIDLKPVVFGHWLQPNTFVKRNKRGLFRHIPWRCRFWPTRPFTSSKASMLPESKNCARLHT